MGQLLRQEIKNFLTASLTPKVSRRCETCAKLMDHLMVTFISYGETWDHSALVRRQLITRKARAA